MQIQPPPMDLPIWIVVRPSTLKRSTGLLINADNPEERYVIRTGPYGEGELPGGVYLLRTAVALDPKAESSVPFLDSCGLAWWAKLEPTFKTERDGFGIHPDGGVLGTEGCVGAVKKDTRSLFESLSAAAGKACLVV